MRHSTLIMLVLLLVLIGLAHHPPVNAQGGSKEGSVASRPQGTRRPISLIAVLADPGKYHGQEIAVQAFFSHSRGEWVIAPDLTSISQDMGVNFFILDLSNCDERDKLEEAGNPGMCFLVGTIDADDYGPREHSFVAGTFRAKKCSGVKLRPEKPNAN
jgi:hypothetical protein